MGVRSGWVGKVRGFRVLPISIVLLAVPAIVEAQTQFLTAGRSALMIQGGADISNIQQKAGETELLKFNSGQPWGAISGMWASGPRTSSRCLCLNTS